VALIGLFDTNGPNYPRYLPTVTAWQKRFYHFRHRVDLHWSNLKLAKGRQRTEYLLDKAWRVRRYFWKKYRRTRKWFRKQWQQWWLPQAIQTVRKSGETASAIYVHRPYPGKIILFRATEQGYGIIEDRALGWSHLVLGGLEIVDVPGHHGSIVRDPRVRILAEKLNVRLQQAQQEYSHPPVTAGE
jgi:hypothetical protein